MLCKENVVQQVQWYQGISHAPCPLTKPASTESPCSNRVPKSPLCAARELLFCEIFTGLLAGGCAISHDAGNGIVVLLPALSSSSQPKQIIASSQRCPAMEAQPSLIVQSRVADATEVCNHEVPRVLTRSRVC